MDSLYDLFNRKKDVCALEERFEYEDQSAIMEDIIQESNLQFIQIQADSYVNELLIEEAMYDDFDEQYIHSLMESGSGEKKDKLIRFVQNKQAKLSAWFKKAIEGMRKTYSQNKETTKTQGGKHVDDPMAMEVLRDCNADVICPIPSNLRGAENKWNDVMEQVLDVYKDHFEGKISLNDAKSKTLNVIGVKDQKEIRTTVIEMYYSHKPVKMKIKDLDHQDIIDCAYGSDDIIANFQKNENALRNDYNATLNRLKGNQEYKNIDEKIEMLNYTTNIQGLLLSTKVDIYKRISYDCKAVINKAFAVQTQMLKQMNGGY